MDKNVIIKRYCEACIELAEYNNTYQRRYNKNFSPQKTVRMGKKLYSYAIKLIDDYLDDFILLLEYDDIRVRKTTATYLYPLYPTKCINIMKEYIDYLEYELDKFTVESYIEGIQKKQKSLMDNFKNIYQCDDLDSLNREK